MYFAKATDVGGGQTVQVDQVAVTVSPQHFKALCNSFVETLKAYENSVGELRIPQADVAPARDAAQIGALIQAVREKRAEERGADITTPSSNEPKPPTRRSRAAAKAKGYPP